MKDKSACFSYKFRCQSRLAFESCAYLPSLHVCSDFLALAVPESGRQNWLSCWTNYSPLKRLVNPSFPTGGLYQWIPCQREAAESYLLFGFQGSAVAVQWCLHRHVGRDLVTKLWVQCSASRTTLWAWKYCWIHGSVRYICKKQLTVKRFWILKSVYISSVLYLAQSAFRLLYL